MLSGFNDNIKHHGVLFHVQTEDSGLKHPHVITHLFHGGNILASEKRGYDDLLSSDNLEAAVKRLMEEQHTTMVRKLKDGSFDPVIRERLGDASFGGRTAVEVDASPEPVVPPSPDRPSSQKPLDEVVLDYLVDAARKRSGK